MEIKTKNLLLKELKLNKTEFNGLIKTSDFFKEIKEISRGSIYFEIRKKDNLVGLIGLEVIGMMNEFKLAKLHFEGLNETDIDEALTGLLDYAINDYFVLKIITHIDNNNIKSSQILKNRGFILNQKVIDKDEYKITKPIYLGK